MALVERLMHWETEPYERHIAVHDFFAAVSEIINGRLTPAQIGDFLDASPEDEAEFNALAALMPSTEVGKVRFVEGIHSVFILAEGRYPGYSTPTEVRAKLGI